MATMTLDDLVGQLRSALGEALRAVVLYGSAAGEEHHAGHSDYNVLVLVDRLTMAELGGALSALARAWRDAGNPAPLLLTVDEWRRSGDIFPMEYADILDRHQVLHGTPPFDGMAIAPADLRLQVEHEAMAKLLQLRTGIMSAGRDAARLRTLLAASLSTFMVIFRGVERLHDGRPGASYEVLARAVATRAGFDATPFERVARHRRGGDPLDDAADVVAGYLDGIEKLVRYLDVFLTGA